MKRGPQQDELQRLISALLDERLSPEEHTRLEALLAADPQARLLYMQMVDQEIELPCVVAAAQEAHKAPALPPVPRSLFARLRALYPGWRRWALGACAFAGVILFATVVRLYIEPVSIPQPITTTTAARDSWSEDFETGAATGWHGQLVTNDLPPGSQYGIAATVREFPGGAQTYVIQLPEEWKRGFVAITTQSVLNVIYRLGNRTHVNVFAHTIPAPEERDYRMYQLTPGGGFPGRSGRWQTASIPFSSFKRKIVTEPGGALSFVGGPPSAGEFVTTLSFASVEPNDLVIDRVWITPTGPTREQIIPLAIQR
jgi:hypothetical protein